MLKPEEYTKTVRRPYPPFFMSLIYGGIREKVFHEKLMQEVLIFTEMVKVDHVIYYPKNTLDRYGQTVPQYWMQPGILAIIEKELQEREDKLINVANGNDLKEFANAYEAYTPALTCIFSCDAPVANEVRKRLSAKISKEEVEKLMDALNIPLRDNYYKKIDRDLVIADDIDSHVREYEWIHSRYGERHPYTKDEALKKLTDINKKEFLSHWQEEKDKLQLVINKAKDILGESQIIDLMQFIIYYRTQRTDVLNKAGYLFANTLESIAKDIGLSYPELLYCTYEEITNKNIPSKDELNERIFDHVMLMEGGVIKCVVGSVVDDIRKMFAVDTGNIKEFKGVSASKGQARGVVRLIKNRDDFSRVLLGDVLVTSMTTPDMVPIMNIASSFITDEGGITCHAAIVSRELKKPCIIGTKIATQVLKDGDLVEVDADKGIVRILPN